MVVDAAWRQLLLDVPLVDFELNDQAAKRFVVGWTFKKQWSSMVLYLTSMVADGAWKLLVSDVPLFDFQDLIWNFKTICIWMNFRRAMVLEISLIRFEGEVLRELGLDIYLLDIERGGWSLETVGFRYLFIWFGWSKSKFEESLFSTIFSEYFGVELKFII